jgi:uncharacterized protein YdeI (YjbR/CyaY-like superfamily)
MRVCCSGSKGSSQDSSAGPIPATRSGLCDERSKPSTNFVISTCAANSHHESHTNSLRHRVADWRTWLRKNHKTAREIWLIYYRKSSGKPRISYNDSVDEALCFGWIDSIQKKIDDERLAQRFSPRRPGSNVSEMNKARARRLVREKRMTPAGLKALGSLTAPRLVIAPDIKAAFEKDAAAWKNFRRFPTAYRRIRIGFVEGARDRPAEFRKRLQYLVTKSAKNEQFGMVRE